MFPQHVLSQPAKSWRSSRITVSLSEGGCWIWRITARKGIGAWGEEILGQRQRQPPPKNNPHLSYCFGIQEDINCDFSHSASSQENMMDTNATIDHCKTPNPVTYEILSWLMVVEFMLGLPLNLSVLYIFIFRYEETQTPCRWFLLIFWKCSKTFNWTRVVRDLGKARGEGKTVSNHTESETCAWASLFMFARLTSWREFAGI